MSVALPLIVPWLGAVALVRMDGRRPGVGWFAVAVVVATLVALAVLAVDVFTDGPRQVTAGDWSARVGITLRADELGVVFALVSAGVVAAALAHQVATGVEHRGFPSVTLFLTAGLTGLFLTGDVFNFYVFFEVAMTATYVLTAYTREAREVRAALIFAVVNLLGTFIFLIAVAGAYHLTGELEMRAVAAGISRADEGAALLVATTFFVAFAVKLGLFPFHYWLPAAYTGSTTAVAAILSGALANIGSYGLIRFGADVMPRELEAGAVALLVLGSASLVYGALQAIHRRDAAEVLAYSAIGQVGYVLVALGIGGTVGIAAAVVYALAVAATKALMFLAYGLRGFLVPAAFVIGALSLVGVPPTAGFFGKLELFNAGVEDGSALVIALVFLGSALSFLYAFQLYAHEFWRPDRPPRSASGPARAAAVVLALAVLVAGLWPEPLLSAGAEAAAAVTGRPGP